MADIKKDGNRKGIPQEFKIEDQRIIDICLKCPKPICNELCHRFTSMKKEILKNG